MNSECFLLASKLIGETYSKQAEDARRSFDDKSKILLTHKKLPEKPWSDQSIEYFLHSVSMMDSNNFPVNVGVGEREGRIASSLVAKRHYFFGHGIGRSGDISAIQPKAAGSSLINKLTNAITLDVLRISGVPSTTSCFVLPMCTGMSLMLCMAAFRQSRPSAKYVIWSRIDQKACFKSIITAGFEPIVIDTIIVGEELRTDVAAIEQEIERRDSGNIACILTTTSCFAPRAPDKLEEVAVLAKKYDIPHLVNNAYGVQSSKCMHLIEQANRVGRLDAYVQSTDKNFMVPVGGAIIAGFDINTVADCSQTYAGRGSGDPSLDLLVTFLSLGKDGYLRLLKERKELFGVLKTGLIAIAEKHNETVLSSPANSISIAFSVRKDGATKQSLENVTALGSKLFLRGVSGARVVDISTTKTISGHLFTGFGSHTQHYPTSYLTCAAALGVSRNDVDTFLAKLDKVLPSCK